MSERYFITGATGLVGSALTEYLASQGNEVVVCVRNTEKASQMFAHLGKVSIVAATLEEPIVYDEDIDYIFHAAAPTDSKFFIKQPVETINSIVLGTRSVLELARQKRVKSIVNLSSMEVYGTPTNEEELTEEKQFYLDPTNVRSNYPLAKRLVENMAVAYHAEYDVPVKSARLAQVLGTELLPDDNRVIVQFIRAAKNGEDITLATDGSTKQTYIALDDTISALMTILRQGENGQVYNVANDETYCSIKEMAETVARNVADNKVRVVTNTDANSGKYPPNRTLRVTTDKLRALGWEPQTSLEDALRTLAK